MENISKIVLSTEGKKLGYVLDLAMDFDAMQKLGYYVVDEESEGEFLLRQENILSFSNEYVLIENALALEFVTQRQSAFGKEILDGGCQSYGHLKELIFRGRKCEKFVTDKCEIAAKYIKNIGQDFIFAEFKRKKVLPSRDAFSRIDKEIVVKTQGLQTVSTPEKIRLSANFYIGKIAFEDIMGYNNEKIIQIGEVVTRHTVEKAKKHNKLNQLYFAIKREK